MATMYDAWCHAQSRFPRVGDVVYRHARPQHPGIVVGAEDTTALGHVTVRWSDGSQGVFSTRSLKSLDALIHETRRTLENHEARAQALRDQLGRDLLGSH